MQFSFDDSPVGTRHFPPAVLKALGILDSLDDGKFVSIDKLAELVGCVPDTLSKRSNRWFKTRMVHTVLEGKVRVLFGNERTVKEWLKTKSR